MAYILLEVENIDEAGHESTEHRELEGVLFRDEKGNERKFKVRGMIPQSTHYMRSIIPDVDWDEGNPHYAILIGEEIKG